MSNKVKIGFLNDTMGPYHYARLDAANLLSDCTFIEFSNQDHTNYWKTTDEKTLKKITLFKEKPITEQNKIDISNRLNQVLTTIDPDVVLISGWDATASLIGLRWCLNNNIPTIILSESQHHDFKRTWLKEFIKKFILKLFDSAFVGGKNQIKYLSILKFPSENIYTGCDLVDNSYFKKNSFIPEEDKESLLIEKGLPKKFFFTSCRFVEKKNLIFLIETFKEFSKNNPSWSLVIAGDGPLKNQLLNTVKTLKLEDKVFFPGYVQYDEMPLFYGLSSCFILPSTTEQWGLVVNESLSCGKPVLVSERCGSAPNLVENKDVGYTFNPYDSSDLLRKMELIISEKNLKLFSANASNVMNTYDKNNYSLNLNNAAKRAIKVHKSKHKNFISILFLKVLIFLSK